MLASVLDARICELGEKVSIGELAWLPSRGCKSRTFKALNWVFGFLSPMRFFRERIASLGGTVLDRITSDISRFRAISSLHHVEWKCVRKVTLGYNIVRRWARLGGEAYRLLLVAREICSSRAVAAEEENHPIMMGKGLGRNFVGRTTGAMRDSRFSGGREVAAEGCVCVCVCLCSCSR